MLQKGGATLQENLDRLEEWASKNLVKINRGNGHAPGSASFRSTAQAGIYLAGKQLCGNGPQGPCGQQSQYE